MSFDYIRETYRVPAKFGGRIEYTGNGTPQLGTITGVDDAHLLIKLDDAKRPAKFHPTWEMRYLPAAEDAAMAKEKP
ncbi:hypothetical protein ACIPEN_14380 [Herbaspirillum chlorophenolicum]|uniref:Uncharacterized protein n=1 Tax=Herbaspirillum chlorophenolicum TaxID=211589 RepID=A0ABW8F146_9BURK